MNDFGSLASLIPLPDLPDAVVSACDQGSSILHAGCTVGDSAFVDSLLQSTDPIAVSGVSSMFIDPLSRGDYATVRSVVSSVSKASVVSGIITPVSSGTVVSLILYFDFIMQFRCDLCVMMILV